MVATTHLSITSSILSRDVVAVLGVYVSNKAFFLASRAVVLLAASFESIAVLSSHRDRMLRSHVASFNHYTITFQSPNEVGLVDGLKPSSWQKISTNIQLLDYGVLR